MVIHFQGFFFFSFLCLMPANFTHSLQGWQRGRFISGLPLSKGVALWDCNLIWGGSPIRSLTFSEPWALTSVPLAP